MKQEVADIPPRFTQSHEVAAKAGVALTLPENVNRRWVLFCGLTATIWSWTLYHFHETILRNALASLYMQGSGSLDAQIIPFLQAYISVPLAGQLSTLAGEVGAAIQSQLAEVQTAPTGASTAEKLLTNFLLFGALAASLSLSAGYAFLGWIRAESERRGEQATENPNFLAFGALAAGLLLSVFIWDHWTSNGIFPSAWQWRIDVFLFSAISALIAWSTVRAASKSFSRWMRFLLFGAMGIISGLLAAYQSFLGVFRESLWPGAPTLWLQSPVLGILTAIFLSLAAASWPRKKLRCTETIVETTEQEDSTLIEEAIAFLREQGANVTDAAELNQGESSPVAASSPIDVFFEGIDPDFLQDEDFPAIRIRPSKDQVDFVERFLALVRKACMAPVETLKKGSGCQLVVEGRPGSGRTTALIVAAIASAVLAGQNVVLVSSSASRRRWLLARIRQRLKICGLDHFLASGEGGLLVGLAVRHTSADSTSTSLGGAARLAPRIFCATTGEWFSFIDQAASMGAGHKTGESAIDHVDCLFIDDFSDIDGVVGSRLIATVACFQALRTARSLVSGIVVALPPVPDVLKPRMVSRMFSDAVFDRSRQWMTIHPVERGRTCKIVEAIAEESPAFVESLTRWLLEKGCNTIMVRPGIDQQTCETLVTRLKSASSKAILHVAGDPDQITAMGMFASAAVYQVHAAQDWCLAIADHLDPSEIQTIFVIRPQKDFHSDALQNQIAPMVASRSSRLFTLCELRLLLAGLQPDQPLLESELKALGFSLKPTNTGVISEKSKVTAIFRADPEEQDTLPSERICFQERTSAYSRSVPASRLPMDVFRIIIDPGSTDTFRLIETTPTDLPAEILWLTASGTELARSDVRNLHDLRIETAGLEDNEITFAANTVRHSEEKIHIKMDQYRGEGGDRIYACPQLEWNLDTDFSIEVVRISDSGWAFAKVLAPTPCRVSFAMGAIAKESGAFERQTPINGHYFASFSLLFETKENAPKQLASKLRNLIARSWNTSPETGSKIALNMVKTAALRGALSSIVAHPHGFTRIVAVDLADSEDPSCLFWFVEPVELGYSVSSLVDEIFASEASSAIFIQRFANFCQVMDVADDKHASRLAARIGEGIFINAEL